MDLGSLGNTRTQREREGGREGEAEQLHTMIFGGHIAVVASLDRDGRALFAGLGGGETGRQGAEASYAEARAGD